MTTKVFENKFGRHNLFSVFKVDEDGEKGNDDKPIVSMGIKKAKAILEHIDELTEFVEQNDQ